MEPAVWSVATICSTAWGNTRLRVHRPLPAAHRNLWLCKKLVGHGLEFGQDEVARGRTVVLAQCVHLGKVQRQVVGQDGGAVDGFLLGAAVDRGDVAHPGLGQRCAHTLQPQRRQRPLGNGHVGADHNVGVGDEVDVPGSGWGHGEENPFTLRIAVR